ncbi:MAG TPA: acyltransferase [Acidimicrobiales bacterium]|jgi:acetyltransferase-like isoleucine patch superfamily enzyme
MPVLGPIERRLVRTYLRARSIPVPRSARFVGFPVITIAPDSVLQIGERFNAVSGRRRHIMGLDHACIIRTVRSGARLIIGDDVGVSGITLCAAYHIEIGSNCLIGANATIIDTNFHPLDPQEWWTSPVPEPKATDAIMIGHDVFIGADTYVLRGSTIGDGAVIGAASVVSGEVPPNSVYAGNPARLIRAK